MLSSSTLNIPVAFIALTSSSLYLLRSFRLLLSRPIIEKSMSSEKRLMMPYPLDKEVPPEKTALSVSVFSEEMISRTYTMYQSFSR
ncbi:MAG: hypothetical protein FWE93_00330 [Alphaproteobacteria bacterium]|nr:hypothetical protein [Alphaproteobacteria bacterium]